MDQPDQIGRFKIDSVLGRGAMGVVYLAQDPVLGREVAIKAIQLHPGLSVEQLGELRQRFETEAKAAAKLAHPNLVTIYDAGLEEDNLYIAMEYVEGQGLESLLGSGRRLSPAEIGQLVGQLASALDYAHDKGIVHRDIKPANILLSKLGHAKITDFGVARQATSNLTATGAMIGTPAYMSPEQVTGSPVSGASDQFSLAIVTYELLTNERPFAGEGATTILYKIVHEAPTQPHALRPELSDALGAAVMRAMSKSPAERFASCAEFAIAICAGLGVAPDPTLTAAASLGAPTAPEAAPDTALRTDPDAATSLDASTAGTSHQRPSTPQQAPPTPQPQPGAVPQATADEGSGPPWTIIGAAAVVVLLLGVWLLMSVMGGDDPQFSDIPLPPEDLGEQIEAAVDAALATVPDLTNLDDAIANRATYTVISRPAGASIRFNGEPLSAVTPAEIEVQTDIEHTLTVELEGYEAVSWRFVAEELPEEVQDAAELFFPLRSTTPAEAATVENDETSGESSTDEGQIFEELPPVDPVRVRGSMQPPELVERGANPAMPDWALEQGLQRYVILELVIDREGRIRDARPLRAVHPDLEALAVAAVRGWTFSPATRDGEAVDVYHNVSVQFEVDDDRPAGRP